MHVALFPVKGRSNQVNQQTPSNVLTLLNAM